GAVVAACGTRTRSSGRRSVSWATAAAHDSTGTEGRHVDDPDVDPGALVGRTKEVFVGIVFGSAAEAEGVYFAVVVQHVHELVPRWDRRGPEGWNSPAADYLAAVSPPPSPISVNGAQKIGCA